MWIGTQQGLNRFDGYRFTPYYYKPGNRRTISHNNVSMVYVSSNVTLWVGTAKGLMCYNEKNDDFKRIDLLPKTDYEPRIAGITEAPDGRVIVGTSGYGLFELKDTIHIILRLIVLIALPRLRREPWWSSATRQAQCSARA